MSYEDYVFKPRIVYLSCYGYMQCNADYAIVIIHNTLIFSRVSIIMLNRKLSASVLKKNTSQAVYQDFLGDLCGTPGNTGKCVRW